MDLKVIFGPGTNTRKPITQDVTINIAPASHVTMIDMLGMQRALPSDPSGNVIVTVGSLPIYRKAGE